MVEDSSLVQFTVKLLTLVRYLYLFLKELTFLQVVHLLFMVLMLLLVL